MDTNRSLNPNPTGKQQVYQVLKGERLYKIAIEGQTSARSSSDLTFPKICGFSNVSDDSARHVPRNLQTAPNCVAPTVTAEPLLAYKSKKANVNGAIAKPRPEPHFTIRNQMGKFSLDREIGATFVSLLLPSNDKFVSTIIVNPLYNRVYFTFPW